MSEPLHFEQCYEVSFTETRAQCALRSLARTYHERTEAFDQTHCRGRDKRGFGRPHDTERTECNRFAHLQHHQLGQHAAYLGFDWRAWRDAISSEARTFESDWVNGLYRNDPRFNGVGYMLPYTSAT